MNYIKEHRPILFNDLCLSRSLWTYLTDFNEQAQKRLELILKLAWVPFWLLSKFLHPLFHIS